MSERAPYPVRGYESFPKEAETRPGEARERVCMRPGCGKRFWSQHRGCRLCDYCRKKETCWTDEPLGGGAKVSSKKLS